MPKGRCLLCHKTKDLQDSHFIGKAVYRRLGEDSLTNPHPVILTNTSIQQSSEQMRDYVFCYDCEQIFNLRGEAWVHSRIATTKGFPLFASLKGYKPIHTESDFSLYNAAVISEWDCEKLLHYGAGIFFKAGVHKWGVEGAKVSIDLGPNLDELRRFVLREAPFPADMTLFLSIAGNANPFLGTVSPVPVDGQSFAQYQFYVPGLMYTLQVGKTIPADTHELAFSASKHKLVFMRDDVSDQAKHFLRSLEPNKDQIAQVMKSIAEGKKKKTGEKGKPS